MAVKAKVNPYGGVQAKIDVYPSLQATVAAGSTLRLTDLQDIDSTLLDDGAVMVYDKAAEKFVIKPEMTNPATKIIGGSF